MVKKKIPLILALGAFMAMGHVSSPFSAGGLEESATDYASNKGVGLHVLRANTSSDGKYEYSNMYVQAGTNSEGKDVLRFATAVKGDISSLDYVRAGVEGHAGTSAPVTVLYKSIEDSNGPAYFDGEKIVNEKSDATEDWYWACYSITFASEESKSLYDAEITMRLKVNGSMLQGFSKTASLNGVKNPVHSYTLNKDSVGTLGGSKGPIDFNENHGQSLGNLNGNEGATLTWFVKSNKEETAEMTLNLALSDGANWGKEVYSAGEDFDVFVNGEIVSSEEGFRFTEGDKAWETYRDYEMLSEVSLNEGYNTIVLKINGAFGNLDHITLDTKAELEVKNSKEVDLKAIDALKVDGTGNMALEKDGDAVVGVGFLDGNEGASFTWKVNAEEATPVFFALNLAVGNGGNVKFSLNVNGNNYENPDLGTLRNTYEWTTYNTYRLPMGEELVKGENTITLTVGSSFGNLGYLKLIGAEELTEISPYAAYRLEAENAQIYNATIYDVNGTKGIDNLGEWASATWTVTVEDVAFVSKVVMGIAINNGNTSSKADFYLSINGNDIIHAPHGSNQSIDVSGDDWYVTKAYEVDVAGLLKKGENTINFTVDSNDWYTSFGNLDYIDFVADRPMTVVGEEPEVEERSITFTKVGVKEEDKSVYYYFEGENNGYEESDFEFFGDEEGLNVTTTIDEGKFTISVDVTEIDAVTKIYPHLRLAGVNYKNDVSANLTIDNWEIVDNTVVNVEYEKSYQVVADEFGFNMPVLLVGLPNEVVGTWDGNDDYETAYTLTIDVDGTAVIENENIEYHFTLREIKLSNSKSLTEYLFTCVEESADDGVYIGIRAGNNNDIQFYDDNESYFWMDDDFMIWTESSIAIEKR